MTMPTPMQFFYEAIREEATKPSYETNLKNFFKCAKTNPDSFVKLNTKEIHDILFDYLIHLKSKVANEELNPNSVPTKFYPIQLFCEQNDIIVNWKKLHRIFPKQKQVSNQGAYIDADIRKLLSSTTSQRNKAFIHFLASTGVRVGAVSDMKVQDVRPVENGAIVDVYLDDVQEYRTCLTPEAYKVLKDYFEWRNLCGYPVRPDSSLFTNKRGSKPITNQGSKDIMRIVGESAGLRPHRNIKRGKKNKSANHAFRKRFTIILANSYVQSKYSAYMSGHFERTTDRNYFRDMTDLDVYKQYKKAIPLLTLDKTQELLDQNEKLEKENRLEIELVKEELHKTRLETLKLFTDILNNPILLKKLQKQLVD